MQLNKKAYTILELKLNIVRALTDCVPLVRAEGKVVHVGNQVEKGIATSQA
jgi:acyl-coenzyme A thioesterase PaaI-like protein